MMYECLFDYDDIQIWQSEDNKEMIVMNVLKGYGYSIKGITEEQLKALHENHTK